MIAKIIPEFNPKIKSQSSALNILSKEIGQKDWNSLRSKLVDEQKVTNDLYEYSLEEKTKKLLIEVMNKWDLIFEDPNEIYDYPLGSIVFRPKSDPIMGIVTITVCQRVKGLDDGFISKIFFADGVEEYSYCFDKIETKMYLQLFERKDMEAMERFENNLFKSILIKAFFHRHETKELEILQTQQHEEAQIGDVYISWTTGDFFEIVKKTKKFIDLREITTTTIKEEDVPLEKRRKSTLNGFEDKRYRKPNYGDIDVRKKPFRKKLYVFNRKDDISPYVLRDTATGEVIEKLKDRDIIWHSRFLGDKFRDETTIVDQPT